jgi:hypothetical protein
LPLPWAAIVLTRRYGAVPWDVKVIAERDPPWSPWLADGFEAAVDGTREPAGRLPNLESEGDESGREGSGASGAAASDVNTGRRDEPGSAPLDDRFPGTLTEGISALRSMARDLLCRSHEWFTDARLGGDAFVNAHTTACLHLAQSYVLNRRLRRLTPRPLSAHVRRAVVYYSASLRNTLADQLVGRTGDAKVQERLRVSPVVSSAVLIAAANRVNTTGLRELCAGTTQTHLKRVADAQYVKAFASFEKKNEDNEDVVHSNCTLDDRSCTPYSLDGGGGTHEPQHPLCTPRRQRRRHRRLPSTPHGARCPHYLTPVPRSEGVGTPTMAKQEAERASHRRQPTNSLRRPTQGRRPLLRMWGVRPRST